jgi:hypothetical protein
MNERSSANSSPMKPPLQLRETTAPSRWHPPTANNRALTKWTSCDKPAASTMTFWFRPGLHGALRRRLALAAKKLAHGIGQMFLKSQDKALAIGDLLGCRSRPLEPPQLSDMRAQMRDEPI